MIKRYNQFVEERINEELDIDAEIDTNEQEAELAERDLEQELDEFEGEGEIEGNLDYDEEEQMEEEGGDIYAARLQEVADKLGCEVTGSKVMCDGKKIMFPSETEMYHVDNKKFKTADEVVEYLRGEGEGPSQGNLAGAHQ